MFRLLYLTFSGSFRGTDAQRHHLHESPATMTVPLIILAILSIIGGFVGVPEVFLHGGERLTSFLAPVVPTATHDIAHSTELLLMAITTVVALIAIFIAWRRYRTYREEKEGGVAKLLENRWYVDELYNSVIVKPLNGLGAVANRYFERSGIDWLVNGVGRLVNYGGRQLRWLQSGQVGSYVLLMVVSMLLFFVLQFFLRK
jgi:NADH-quinone oxidoreductase subunit L